MDAPTIYSQLKLLAAPVVRYYHDDLTVHDLRLCNRLDKGDVFMWAPRECGTCAVILKADSTIEELRVKAELLDASVSIQRPPKWFIAEVTSPRRGVVKSTKPEQLARLIAGRIEALERMRKWEAEHAAGPH